MHLTHVPPELDALETAAVLSPLDVHFAMSLARLVGEQRMEVLLAAALISRRTRDGHVCQRLDEIAGRPVEQGQLCLPELACWREALSTSDLVTSGRERRPLVLDRADRLYLHRYYEHEQRLAAMLRERSEPARDGFDPKVVREVFGRLFPSPVEEPLNDQQLAVLVALVQRFTIISGGPGTGKTTTVARLLALVVELCVREGRAPPRMLLVAPTGKAAGRLAESIRRAKMQLDAPGEVLGHVPEEALTIHRALGVRPFSTRPARDASRPLVADLVLVDEASMVDLALMRRLAEAVPPEARLVLLGDRNQLASVEAGSVLGDLCLAAQPHASAPAYGDPLVDRIEALSGRRIARAAGKVPLLRNHVVELTKSYRFDARSGIGRLSVAVQQGDLPSVLEVLERGGDVSWTCEGPTPELSKAFLGCVLRGFQPLLEARDAGQALAALARFRVLSPHRRGWAGVEHLNERVRDAFLRHGAIERGEFFSGRPILVTQNDYAVGLFNGDVGLAWADASGTKVHFEAVSTEEGGMATRPISPARLPGHETAFALSVHKSQGSEHEEVAIVLPDADSPLLSRELLYTAITRARRSVHLFATREAIEASLGRRVARASGLGDALANG